MTYEIDTKLQFGQYLGLTVKEIFQGTLNLNKGLLKNYLDFILNKELLENRQDFGSIYFNEVEFIDNFEVYEFSFKIIGEIDNPEKELSNSNRMKFGNIEKKIESYINSHFSKNYLGILKTLNKFNFENQPSSKINGDPEYLVWCEKNINNFILSINCKIELENFSVSLLKGFKILYIGDETYEFFPEIDVRSFSFNILKNV